MPLWRRSYCLSRVQSQTNIDIKPGMSVFDASECSVGVWGSVASIMQVLPCNAGKQPAFSSCCS